MHWAAHISSVILLQSFGGPVRFTNTTRQQALRSSHASDDGVPTDSNWAARARFRVSTPARAVRYARTRSYGRTEFIHISYIRYYIYRNSIVYVCLYYKICMHLIFRSNVVSRVRSVNKLHINTGINQFCDTKVCLVFATVVWDTNKYQC